MSQEIAARLEASREELLDLGLRNPLINHRRRARQIRIQDERSREVYRLLVIQGRKLRFRAAPEEAQTDPAAEPADWRDQLEQPEQDPDGSEPAAHHTDNLLQTVLPSRKLQSRLLSMYYDARTYREEQGVNILFIALGFLHWYESATAERPRRAPLLLIPVEIQRASARQRFQLAYTGEDLGDNLSLQAKLRAEFGIELPDMGDPDELDVPGYFDAVETAVKAQARWKVAADEISIGFFSFGKFLMYRDLDADRWLRQEDAPGFGILDALLVSGFAEAASRYDESTRVDDVLVPEDSHQVKDADSTQLLAILDVASGRNLVLQGPPGTGKSQTITNIIADCIGDGRKVLFVSEKMAALEVVKRRLDGVGLGDAVLELHSHKTNKKQVLRELERTLKQGKPVGQDGSADIDDLARRREQLNAYCDAVHAPIGGSGEHFVSALGQALKRHPGTAQGMAFDFQPMQDWSESDYRAARMLVEELDAHLRQAGPPRDNIFFGSRLEEFLPAQQPELRQRLEDARQATRQLAERGASLAAVMGLETPVTLSRIDVCIGAAQRLSQAPDTRGLDYRAPEWSGAPQRLQEILSAGKALAAAHARYDDLLLDLAWEQDLLAVRQQYLTRGNRWWRWLSGDFRRARNRLQGLMRQPLAGDVGEVIAMIDAIMDSHGQRRRLQTGDKLCQRLFGRHWRQQASDWPLLERQLAWMRALHRDIADGHLPEALLDYLADPLPASRLDAQLQEADAARKAHALAIARAAELLQLRQQQQAASHWNMSLEAQERLLASWLRDTDRLFSLLRFNRLYRVLAGKGLQQIGDAALDWQAAETGLLQRFEYSWFNGLVERAYRQTPLIKEFDRTQHHHVRDEFLRLDHLLFRYNRLRLALQHWRSLPRSNSGEVAILRREINKKRRHMPIRKLMLQAGRAIQAIKPVFMMSPISIASHVPPGCLRFDLVVFDEASQVKPVDAFGAILRARQAVVVGDSRQLPPTSFFDSLAGDDGRQDYDAVGDMESILSLFLGKGAPERMLRWHYRSRHDSLIRVSNHEFYGGGLVVFPSPGGRHAARGLGFHHLPDSAYQRGGSRSNPGEARAVAEAVLQHAGNHPDLSLGVVAFSTAQRDELALQLELLRRTRPECEAFFREDAEEPFFIKNLENVQGDERDMIFISIGYGKDPAGNMTMNFGPLNRDGGERRLNVLITRARLAMDVFCNFTADDIDLERSSARGVQALKKFLAFARDAVLPETGETAGQAQDTAFEDQVLAALRGKGILAEPRVGSGGSWIDIGVRDPADPQRFLLGVETDGASYRSARSARDRDRLRREVLQGLGWRLYRVWSVDWYRNPERELDRLLEAIRQAASPLREQSPTRGAANPPQVPIVRESGVEPAPLTGSQPYRRHLPDIALGDGGLHELPVAILSGHIAAVVAVESPLHRDELLRRLLDGAALKRAGKRIRQAVNMALDLGVREGRLLIRGDFVWRPGMTVPPVRDRSRLDKRSRRLDHVASEEIREALRQQIQSAFSLEETEALANAARMLGFHRLTTAVRKRLQWELMALIGEGVVQLDDERLTIAPAGNGS